MDLALLFILIGTGVLGFLYLVLWLIRNGYRDEEES